MNLKATLHQAETHSRSAYIFQFICNGCKKISFTNRSDHAREYCNRKCYLQFAKKENHSCWKGGCITQNGYRFIFGQYEHRVVMEKFLKRKLLPGEIVHHINHNKLDNRIENLEIISRSAHTRLHQAKPPASKKCKTCGSLFFGAPMHIKNRIFCSQFCYHALT